ncbi:hypothetical protein Bca4012_035004 [Brassica carinata]
MDKWFEELVGGPLSLAMSSPAYFTRGYAFKVSHEGTPTVNSGISVQAGDISYYGVLKEILEVEYPGAINLKCILFLCDWYNSQPGIGVRHTKFGVIEVNSSKRLNKYDPFILGSQADQVSYIRYPRIKHKRDPWITVTNIIPRGRVCGLSEKDPLQQNSVDFAGSIDQSVEPTMLVDIEEATMDNILEISEEELGEFEEYSDSASSEYSSDSE